MISQETTVARSLVVITGASSGIGRATALLLAGTGWTVVAADRDEVGLETVRGEGAGAINPFVLDVADWQAVVGFARDVVAMFGVPTALVCAAGINPPTASTGDVDEAFWDLVVDVNLKGMFTVCRAFLPDMATQRCGSIVNLASASGLVGWGGSSVYCATKGGAIALTRALATEYAAVGIRVNCVCPGSIRTPMVLNNLAAFPDASERLARTAAQHPIGRIGEAEEVAQSICFLLSPAASFITGVALPVDGGFTAR